MPENIIKKEILFLFTLFFLTTTLPAQVSYTDSLTRLLNTPAAHTQKAAWLLQRSRSWPGAEIDRPMADAQEALAIYQQTGTTKGQAEAYLQIAGLYSRQSKFQQALELDSMALKLAEEVQDKKITAAAFSHLGRNFQALGNQVQAEKVLLQALQLQKETGGERESAETHNRLGIFYRQKPDIKKSLYHFDEGIAVAKKYNATLLLATIYMNKANSLNEAARYDEAIEMHLESIRLKDKMNDQRGLMQSYNNIALVFKRANEYEKSKEYFLKANELARKMNNPSTLGYNYANLGTLYALLNKKDSVAWMFEQSLAAFNKTSEKPGLGLVYHNYGTFLMEEKQYDRSEAMLKKALAIRQEIKGKYDVASTMNLLGALYSRMGNTKEAETRLLQSLALLKDENSYRKKDAYGYLAEHYKSLNDFEEAYKYQAAYLAMSDTLVDEREMVTVLRKQNQYELEKKEAELVLEKREKKIQALAISKKNQLLVFITCGLLLSVLLLFFLYKNYRDKKNYSQVLERKNQQVETLIRELHHRVKNNLQTVSGLLSLQSNRIQDDEIRQIMEDGKSRVEAMALIHQKLYLNNELASVNIEEYLHDLSNYLAGSFGHETGIITTQVQLSNTVMDIDRAIPIGLIVNELITNAFKYAVNDIPNPEINLKLVEQDSQLALEVADNGKGNTGKKSGKESFGLQLVSLLVQQLDGKMESFSNHGTHYRITMAANNG